MFKKIFITGVLLIAIGGIGALLTAKSYFSASEQEKSATTFADVIIDEIDIKGNLGSLTIQQTDGDAVTVESIGPKKGQSINIEQDGRTLKISTPNQAGINFGIQFNKQATDLIIHLPEKTYRQITADTEVGSIDISGINAEIIKCESEVGDINIKDSAGKLVLKNEIGNINIKVLAIKASITASNEIGDIAVSISETPKDHYISANSEIGSIQIFGKKSSSYMSGNGSIAVDLKTEVGDIDLTN